MPSDCPEKIQWLIDSGSLVIADSFYSSSFLDSNGMKKLIDSLSEHARAASAVYL
jgi:hypothetical protein